MIYKCKTSIYNNVNCNNIYKYKSLNKIIIKNSKYTIL